MMKGLQFVQVSPVTFWHPREISPTILTPRVLSSLASSKPEASSLSVLLMHFMRRPVARLATLASSAAQMAHSKVFEPLLESPWIHCTESEWEYSEVRGQSLSYSALCYVTWTQKLCVPLWYPESLTKPVSSPMPAASLSKRLRMDALSPQSLALWPWASYLTLVYLSILLY